MKIPAFHETSYQTDVTSKNTVVTVIFQADEAQLSRYAALFAESGYVEKQSYRQAGHVFFAFAKGDEGVFLNYFAGTEELYIVVERQCKYFAYQDEAQDACVTSEVTQIHLEDFGLSYAVRLSDGRFIVFDGGWEFEPDTDRLYQVLQSGSPHEKPIIACWVLTHPHFDHYHAFLTFTDKYAEHVTVQRVLCNFPEPDDTVHYPGLSYRDRRVERDTSAGYNIPLMLRAVEKCGAELTEVHTGQIYRIGNAVCQVLSCMDDTVHKSKNINAISTVFRMDICGQVILWTADMIASDSAIVEKYGEYLRCDILQIPHHGFGSGMPQAETDFYRLASPKVCLIPASDYNAYTCFCAYYKPTALAMRSLGVEEFIAGDDTRTLTLPYTAPKHASAELERNFLRGRDNGGAPTWIFSDLQTDVETDHCFTVLNTANAKATVMIDVFFEDPTQNVRYIKTEVSNESVRRINIFDSAAVDGDALYFNWMSLAKLGVPAHARFSVRFMSDIPVVISHENHTAAYHSTNR